MSVVGIIFFLMDGERAMRNWDRSHLYRHFLLFLKTIESVCSLFSIFFSEDLVLILEATWLLTTHFCNIIQHNKIYQLLSNNLFYSIIPHPHPYSFQHFHSNIKQISRSSSPHENGSYISLLSQFQKLDKASTIPIDETLNN